MKLSNRMLNHLEKFGEYDTPKYRYYIGANNGCEYVKRYSDSLHYVYWCCYHYAVYQSVQFYSCNRICCPIYHCC